MELRVFDKKLEPLGTIDELASLIWKTKYFNEGTFSLLAPVTNNNKKLLIEGNILTKHEGKEEFQSSDGGKWRRAAQITYKHISKDEKGLEQIEVQGYMLSYLLNQRCICPQIIEKATNQRLINMMVDCNCGKKAGIKRSFPQFDILEQLDMGGSVVEYANEIYAGLGLEVRNRAQAGKLGYDILINEREKKYGFYLYKGKDLTSTNNDGNTPCIFSRDFDNVNEQEFTSSIENCGNFIYVIGAADESGDIPSLTVDKEGAAGFELMEIFCNASDIARKKGDSEEVIPLESYFSMLQTRGAGELEKYGKVINFTSLINTKSNLIYKRDFNIGDRITCKEKRWGIQIDARITEVTETYQNGKKEIEVTFGESLPTLVEQIRKVR